MDTTTRNRVFMENEDLIKGIMRYNYPLIQAVRLEWDDVYQELAVAALNAINTFDPLRSSEIRAHIWMKLQYAILDIRRRHRPYGMTGAAEPRPQVCSMERLDEMGYPLPSPTRDTEDTVLIYNQSRSHTEVRRLTRAIERRMKRSHKYYLHARMRKGHLVLGSRAREQSW